MRNIILDMWTTHVFRGKMAYPTRKETYDLLLVSELFFKTLNFIEDRHSNKHEGKKKNICMCVSQNLTDSFHKSIKKMLKN